MKKRVCCFCEENQVSLGFDYCSRCDKLYSALGEDWYNSEWAQATIKSERKYQYHQSKTGELKLSEEAIREAVAFRYGAENIDNLQMQQMIEIDVSYKVGVYYSTGATMRNEDGTFARKIDFDMRLIEMIRNNPAIGGKRAHHILTEENNLMVLSLSTVHRRLRELRKAA